MTEHLTSTSVIVAMLAVMVSASSADAASRRDGIRRAAGTITACSRYGRHGCITARVRTTSLGPQYLSRGGNWVWCEHDCRDTLRRDTIDFWDDQRERNK